MTKVIDVLRKYNPRTYPVSNLDIDFIGDELQDGNVKSGDLNRTTAEKTNKKLEEITNVLPSQVPFDRTSTYFSYFLDGTRRAYYLYDMATGDGNVVPILAGQVAAAVLKRDRATGNLSVHKHYRRGLLILPTGGGGLNDGDANDIKKEIEEKYDKNDLSVDFVTIRNRENPKDNSLAKLNMEMQNIEIQFLEDLTNSQELDQTNMVIVDGALQFRNVKKDKIANLRYAIGLSKSFNLHLTNVIGKTKEIGSLLINLKNVGDRTVAYKLAIAGDDKKYAFWYLRIRPMKYLDYPFAGIVKIEKVLVTPEENEDGLDSDEINNISRCILIETSVSPYGSDKRWASHIYPIFLTEQLQKNKFLSDYIFKSFF